MVPLFIFSTSSNKFDAEKWHGRKVKESAPLKLPTRYCLRTFFPYRLAYTYTKNGISLTSRIQPRSNPSNLSHLCYAMSTYTQYQATVKLLGSFRLAAGRGHLHPHCIFTELFPETVVQSLRHSCASELTRQGISLNYSSQLDSIFILHFRDSDAWCWSLVNHVWTNTLLLKHR